MSLCVLFVSESESSAIPPVGSDNPIVHTIYGPVRGYTESGIKGRQYYAFKGIPYAKPPVGDLRFEVSSFPIRCGHSSVNRSIGL